MVYVDLLILSNFLLDYSILLFTGYLTRQNIKWWRIFLATCVAVSSVGLFWIEFTVLFLILRLAYSFLIVFCAFGYQSFKKYSIHLMMFYVVNYLMAGLLISFNMSSNFIRIDFFNIKIWLLLLVSFIIANILTYTLKVQLFHFNLDIPVKFKIFDYEYECTGFLDTGNDTTVNRLTPVIFVNEHYLKETITRAVLEMHQREHHYIQLDTFHQSSLALAFKPDYFEAKIDHRFLPFDVYLVTFNGKDRSIGTIKVILNKNLVV